MKRKPDASLAARHEVSYTDRVEIKAGALTPFVGLLAWFIYRHRQRRWKFLVANGFTYGRSDGRSALAPRVRLRG